MKQEKLNLQLGYIIRQAIIERKQADKGFTMLKLAKLSGVGESTVYIAQKGLCTIETLMKVCKGLRINLDVYLKT